MWKPTCLDCLRELTANDADPNGEPNPTCKRCREEQNTDFDKKRKQRTP